MEKWMIVYLLPLEVWMDIFVFPWISRQKFGQLVAKIGSFKFAEHAQFYLHEWGKRSLGNVRFQEDGIYKLVNRNPFRVSLPQTPLPENIKSIGCIEIKHFDANTIDFLTKITPLLTDLEIVARNIGHLENLRTILAILAPMLDGIRIRSVSCGFYNTLSVVKKHFFCENKKLAELKYLEIDYPGLGEEQRERIDFIVNWLAQPDTDGPRFSQLCSHHGHIAKEVEAIRQQFLAATAPRTFAANLKLYYPCEERPITEFHLANGIGEELHGKWTEIGYEEVFQITRHRAGWNTEEARKWIKEMAVWKDYPRIWISHITIGSLDALTQVDVDVEDQDKDKECKQLCSIS